MTDEKVIELYKKANGWSVEGWEKTIKELKQFAALVAAAEREACAVIAFNAKTYIAAANAIRARGQE